MKHAACLLEGHKVAFKRNKRLEWRVSFIMKHFIFKSLLQTMILREIKHRFGLLFQRRTGEK